jgi:hypothetical protein
MKLIKLIDESLKSLFGANSKKENALQIVQEETQNKGGGMQDLSGKNIGEQPLSVVLPHLKVVADTYNLKLSNASDFKLARVILTSWLSKQNIYSYATL